jgi:DNA polymerase
MEELVEAIMSGDPDMVEMLIGAPPVETVLSALRHAIIASPGRELVSGDFSTIEARFVLSLAGQHDKTAIMAAGKDIYNDMASQIYGRPIDRKGADKIEGQVGKNSVLGLGFQMGAPKFRARYAKDQPMEFCEGVVQTYRKKWAPLVPKVWYTFDEAALRTVWDKTPHSEYGVDFKLEDGWLTARIPSGRKLWYFNPQPIRKAMPWDPADVRPAWTYQAQKMGQLRTIDAFGGLLTENVVQAMARDLMCAAMFKAEQNGLPIILTVHDEIVCEPEVRPDNEKVLGQIMVDRPTWAANLQVPVATETWTSGRYKK